MNLRAIKLKLTTLCLFIVLSINLVYSQGQWSWINGDSTANGQAVYVIKGAHPNNRPGSRHGAVSWTDKAGNIGLFGGYGATPNASPYLNDLWKFDIATNQWNWVSGDNIINQTGIYKHLTDPGKNKPGSRSDAVSWTDNAGNLWLFGGFGYASKYAGFLNDLWKFNSATNQWAWISGDTTENNRGVYAKNGADLKNKPGSRHDAVSWIDKAGNLWLFGGEGYAAAGGTGKLNDLWKYDITTNQWSWISGDNIINQRGIYKDLTDPRRNKPRSRDEAAGWADGQDNLWLFGGDAFATGRDAELNDLWKFNIINNQWSWVSGDSTTDNPGIYKKGTAENSKPASRNDAVSWADASGNLWLFGGSGYTSTGEGLLNDLWQFNTESNKWNWISGDSTIKSQGKYTTKGPHAANTPGSRYGAVNWVDAGGKLWLLGGYGYPSKGEGHLNDLWKFIPCNVPGGTKSTVVVTAGQPYPLSARPDIGNQYSWSPTAGLNDPKSPAPLVTTNNNVTYFITMTAASGCVTVDTQNVVIAKPVTGKDSVVAVPTAFTPNKNGMNDRLKPIPYAIKTLTYFKVFNRWGQLVFETNIVGTGWDGTLKGTPQPTETYTWILECISASGTKIRQSGKSLLIR